MQEKYLVPCFEISWTDGLLLGAQLQFMTNLSLIIFLSTSIAARRSQCLQSQHIEKADELNDVDCGISEDTTDIPLISQMLLTSFFSFE